MSNLLLVIILIGKLDTLKLNIDRAYQIALLNNKDLKIQEIQDRIQTTLFRKSLINYLPSVNFTGSYSNTKTFFPYYGSGGGYTSLRNKGYELIFTISQNIFSPSALAGIAENTFSKKKSSFELVEKKKEIYISVISSCINYLKAKNFLEVLKKSLQRAEENKRLYEERYRLKSASKLDLLNAEVNLKQKQSAIKDAEKALSDAKWDLLITMGIQQDKIIILEDSLPFDSLEQKSFEEWKKFLKEKKEKLLAQNEEKKKGFIEFLKSSFVFLPEIKWNYYIVYQDSLFPKSYASFWNSANKTKGFYLFLTFPFFDYPMDVSISKASYELDKAIYQKTLLSLIQELEKGIAELINIKEKIELLEQTVFLSESAFKLARTEYALGKISLIELLSSEENYLSSQIDYVNTKYDYYFVIKKINFIAGILKEKEI